MHIKCIKIITEMIVFPLELDHFNFLTTEKELTHEIGYYS